LNYGNFAPSALTANILPFIQRERAKVSASTVQRDKSQYRVFFNDGYGLFMCIVNQRYLGAVPVFFPNPVFCCDEGKNDEGVAASYFGSSDEQGYVYQLDAGTSFDGEVLDAYITLAWDFLKSPRINKRFRRGSVEIQSDGYALVSFGYRLGYGSSLIGQPGSTEYASNFFAAPTWDEFIWDLFTWDGETLSPTDVGMDGRAENVQVTITSGTNYIDAFTVNSIIYSYSMGRILR